MRHERLFIPHTADLRTRRRLPAFATACAILSALAMAIFALPARGPAIAQEIDASIPAEHRFGLKRPKPKPAGAVRIATYNIENFFDPFDDPALEGEWDDAKMTTAPERREAIAKAIRAMDADILALQEVESLEALRWFRDTYLDDMGYEYLASRDVGYYRGIENSILSRYEITNVETRAGASLDDVKRDGPGWDDVPAEDREGMTIQRSPLRADIAVNEEYTLTLFSVQHKSGRDYRYKREAEALVINAWIDEIESAHPDRNIIALGDFNAAPWDKSFRLYLQHGFVDTLAHRIIPRWRNADQDEARLYKTHRSDRVIDYILMNPEAYGEYIVGSAHVYGTPTAPEDWNWREDPYPADYASDHFPVIADLTPHE